MKLLKNDTYRYTNQLEVNSASGWHKCTYIKCYRNVGKYKIYLSHFNCALPYTNLYLVNTENGEVLQSEELHFGVSQDVKKLIEELKEREK